MAMNGTFGSSAGTANTPTVRVIAYGAGSQGSCLTTKAVNNWDSQMMPVIIPGGSVGIGGYLNINFELSNSTQAGVANRFFMTMAGVTLGPVVSISAVGHFRGNIRIRNIDNSAQVATLAYGDGTAASTNLFRFSANMAVDQQLTFWGNGQGVASQCIALKGWSVEAHNISATATPAALIPGRKIFYGINAHIDEGNGPTTANRISAMKAMGLNVLRVSWFGPTHSSGGVLATTWIQDMASAFAADAGSLGLNMMVMVGCGFGSYSVEADAYSAGFAQGVYAANAFGPKGVLLYETGNEIDADTLIRRTSVTQGTTLDDFSLSSTVTWAMWRGNMRGCYDGIKSILPTAQVGSNAFTNASIWASDALWNGTDPQGNTGNPQVRWDWTNWHTYTEGDMTDVPYSGNAVNFNLLKYLHNAYGKPVLITEWNPAEATTASSVAHINQWMTTWYSAQAIYNIGGIVWFSWFDGIYAIAGTAAPSTVNAMGAAMINFISAHPALK